RRAAETVRARAGEARREADAARDGARRVWVESRDRATDEAGKAEPRKPRVLVLEGDAGDDSGAVYVVRPGETFGQIATKHAGDYAEVVELLRRNPDLDLQRLRVGQ